MKSAAALGRIQANLSASDVFMVGDNFYDHGVKSADSHRFQDTFENVYTADSLTSSTFHVIAGNHDHKGNVSAQIAYRSPINNRWHFPDYNYSVTLWDDEHDMDVQVVMVDTVILCGDSDDADVVQPAGPSDHLLAQSHFDWLEDQLKSSTAAWLIVMGHYPVYSVNEHGPTKCLVKSMRPLLQRYRVNVYVCGHEHAEDYLEYQGVSYVVNGGGHDIDDRDDHLKDVPPGSLLWRYPVCPPNCTEFDDGLQGQHPSTPVPPNAMHPLGSNGDDSRAAFTSFAFNNKFELDIQYYAEDGTVLYQRTVKNRRINPPTPASP
jgi:tartrate-resistant acid phosphatase type 5